MTQWPPSTDLSVAGTQSRAAPVEQQLSSLQPQPHFPRLELYTEADVEAVILHLCDCTFDMSSKDRYRAHFKRQASKELKKFYDQLRVVSDGVWLATIRGDLLLPCYYAT